MLKPEHQWETRLHRARRLERDRLDLRLSDDARGEAFELRFADLSARASLGLQAQFVDAAAYERDPQLADAVRAWLVARGSRRLALHSLEGELILDEAIGPASLHSYLEAEAGTGAVRRIVTLCPSAAELVHALGAFDRVVACENSSDFPPEVESMERLGPDLGPDLDRVAELAPDLVVSSLSVPGMERVVSGLAARGLPQFVSAPSGIDDVRDEMLQLGRALGCPEAAADALATFDEERAALERTRPAKPTRVFLEWWPRPIFSPGRDCYSNELIALAGGVNVCGDLPGSSLEVSPDQVLASDPDIYFISWCGVAADKLDPARVATREGFENLRAAKAKRIFPLDESFAGRPGPRMLEAARIMARAIRGDDA